MVTFFNQQYSDEKFNQEDLFICAIGYEERSYFLYNKVLNKIRPDHILILAFNDYENYDHTKSQISKISKENSVRCRFLNYQNYEETMQIIDLFINQHKEEHKELKVHVDYSSMPRSWYSRLPRTFESTLEVGDKVFFWYVEGVYPEGYNEYPSAGIDSFAFYSGRPTLRIENKRTHVLSLGYDTIRTQAIISILDPESMIVCNAYNSNNREVSERVKRLNKELITQAMMVVTLQIDDFSFMVSKLCELAYEYQPTGDVIFIPDGPKPLILAMSLIPDIVDMEGVTCMHIVRNKEYYNPINVLPKNNIWGFSIQV